MRTITLKRKSVRERFCFYNPVTKRWWDVKTGSECRTFKKASIWKHAGTLESTPSVIKRLYDISDAFIYHEVEVEFTFKTKR